MKSHLLAVALAMVHAVGFSLLLLHLLVRNSEADGWNLAVWMLIDMPWSLFIYQLISNYYVAYLVHLLVGTLWWFAVGYGIGLLCDSVIKRLRRFKSS